jgi:hypothetical protein
MAALTVTRVPEYKYATPEERHSATHNSARARKRASHVVQFIALDGEGTGRGKNHRYVELGVGDKYIANPDGLDPQSIFSFLWSQYLEHPNATFVGFYLSYDFNQWLRQLPRNRGEYLFTELGIRKRQPKTRNRRLGPFPVRWNGWEFDILGVKRFKLRPEGETRWMYICDAGSFFQSSFMKAINPAGDPNPCCTAEEYELIVRGKDRRADAALDAEMIEYNLLENKILARRLSQLNEGLIRMGVRLSKQEWFGPGQASQKWMASQNVPDQEALYNAVPWQALEYAHEAYFGGWFEVMIHGHIPGVSYEYDINSAYPYVIKSLPCLLHGRWEYRDPKGRTAKMRVSGKPKNYFAAIMRNVNARSHMTDRQVVTELPELAAHQLRLIYGRVYGSNPHIGTMLLHDLEMMVMRPDKTEGWFWQHEVQAAINARLIDRVEIDEWVTYTPCTCKPPLRGLADLYALRLEAGKNTAAGKSSKLVYNSTYGKLCQQIGDPRYLNFIYASLITAGCRTQILDAIATHPEGAAAVIMVATDAVFFTSEHPGLSRSPRLGDWELKERSNLTVFKPGVYWDDEARNGVLNFKARGVNAKAFSNQLAKIDRQFASWDGVMPPIDHRCGKPECPCAWPKVTFNAGFSMVTCKQALNMGKWFMAGRVSDETVTTQFSSPVNKRMTGGFDGKYYRSTPFRLKVPEISSTAYAHDAPKSKEDTVPVNPEGYSDSVLYEILGMID